MDTTVVEHPADPVWPKWHEFARFQAQVEAVGGRVSEPYSVQHCPQHGPMELRPAAARGRSLRPSRRARWACPLCGLRR